MKPVLADFVKRLSLSVDEAGAEGTAWRAQSPPLPPLFFIGVLQHEDGVVDLQGWT